MQNPNNINNIISQTCTATVDKGKQILHLVLQRKPVSVEALEELEKEVSERMIKFIKRIMGKLEKTKFDNPEQAIKVIFLKGLIKILKKLVSEYEKQLSPEDLQVVNQIFANEENNIKIEESKLIVDKNKTSIEEEQNPNDPDKNKKNECLII